jgi:hypothetical protein
VGRTVSDDFLNDQVRRVGVVVITLQWCLFESRQRRYVGTCHLGKITHSHCLASIIRRSFIDIWSVNTWYLPSVQVGEK